MRHVAQVLDRHPGKDTCKKRQMQHLSGRRALLGAHTCLAAACARAPRGLGAVGAAVCCSPRLAQLSSASRRATPCSAACPARSRPPLRHQAASPAPSASSTSRVRTLRYAVLWWHSARAHTGECSHQELLCCGPAILCERVPGLARLCCRPLAPLQERCQLRGAHGWPLAQRQADCCSGQAAGGQHALLQQRRQATGLAEHYATESASM